MRVLTGIGRLAVIVLCVFAPETRAQHIEEIVVPEGPDLNQLAEPQIRAFVAGLPEWFSKRIDYEITHRWSSGTTVEGFVPERYRLSIKDVYYKKDGRCRYDERRDITGQWETYTYGRAQLVLGVGANTRERLDSLHDSALRLSAKKTYDAFADSVEPTAFQFLIEHAPIIGELAQAYYAGENLPIEKMERARAEFNAFAEQIEHLKPLLNKGFASAEAGYDNAVFQGLEIKTLDSFLTDSGEVGCDDAFWAGLDEGDERVFPANHRSLKAGEIDQVKQQLARPRQDRNYDFLTQGIPGIPAGHGRLVVKIRDALGQLVPWGSAWVSIFRSGEDSVVATLDGSGWVDVPAGLYSLGRGGREFAVVAGRRTTVGNEPLGRIAVGVRPAGAIPVYVYRSGDDKPAFESQRSGRFDVPPGRYRVEVAYSDRPHFFSEEFEVVAYRKTTVNTPEVGRLFVILRYDDDLKNTREWVYIYRSGEESRYTQRVGNGWIDLPPGPYEIEVDETRKNVRVHLGRSNRVVFP